METANKEKDHSSSKELRVIGDRPLFNVQHYQSSGEPVNVPFSRRDFYKIWLIDSKSILHYADKSVQLSKPALIFSNPLVPYAYETLETNRSGYWCIFEEEFLVTNDRVKSLQESPLFKIGNNPVFFPDEAQLISITRLFDQMISEMATGYLQKYDMMINYVNLLLHEGMKMQPDLPHQHHNASSRIASLFLELLENQFPIETTKDVLKLRKVSEYAYSLSIHINHLNFAVKEITGKTTSAHIAERIINEAKALLKHTDWSIAEIAYVLGFEYANHFNNFFKKHTAVTPLSFRK